MIAAAAVQRFRMRKAVDDSGAPGPVKMVLERRVQPAARQAFEEWASKLMDTASHARGLQGSTVLNSHGEDYFLLFRFGTQAQLNDWQSSPDVVALMRQGEALSAGPAPPVLQSGLETWFVLPGRSKGSLAPAKWKMALVTWLALLPQVMILKAITPDGLPYPVVAAASTGIPVAALTWIVMPRLTNLLSTWLYRGAPTRPPSKAAS